MTSFQPEALLLPVSRAKFCIEVRLGDRRPSNEMFYQFCFKAAYPAL